MLIIIAAVLAGWSATGYAQADPESSQSLAGAWNVKIEFDTPSIEGCTAPGMNTLMVESWQPGAHSQRAPDTVTGYEPVTANSESRSSGRASISPTAQSTARTRCEPTSD